MKRVTGETALVDHCGETVMTLGELATVLGDTIENTVEAVQFSLSRRETRWAGKDAITPRPIPAGFE